MSADSTDKMLAEIRDRTTRLESRLVQLGDYVGANLRNRQKIEIIKPQGLPPHVQIDALDVSVSRIATELRQHNVRAGTVPVLLNGECVIFINLDNLK